MSKTITLRDFLTSRQIEQARQIWRKNKQPAALIAKEVIAPNMAEINKKLGQENDARYLAYLCEHQFNRSAV